MLKPANIDLELEVYDLTQGASTMAAETACHTGSGNGSRPLCYQQHASGA